MSFDPNLPQELTPADAAQIRAQFNGLKALIDLLQSINAAQIDDVTTGNPGDPATATVTVNGQTLHFTLSIPRGDEGIPGVAGIDGAQGPPFAQAIIDAVNTLNPGELATVTVNFDGTDVRFTFGIPRGEPGEQGIQGIPGTDGAPGEVTNAQLAAAISGTSNNSNAVATLDTPFADPDMESMRQKLNEFLLAARR